MTDTGTKVLLQRQAVALERIADRLALLVFTVFILGLAACFVIGTAL